MPLKSDSAFDRGLNNVHSSKLKQNKWEIENRKGLEAKHSVGSGYASFSREANSSTVGSNTHRRSIFNKSMRKNICRTKCAVIWDFGLFLWFSCEARPIRQPITKSTQLYIWAREKKNAHSQPENHKSIDDLGLMFVIRSKNQVEILKLFIFALKPWDRFILTILHRVEADKAAIVYMYKFSLNMGIFLFNILKSAWVGVRVS